MEWSWIEFAKRCGYLKDKACEKLDKEYDQIMGQLVKIYPVK